MNLEEFARGMVEFQVQQNAFLAEREPVEYFSVEKGVLVAEELDVHGMLLAWRRRISEFSRENDVVVLPERIIERLIAALGRQHARIKEIERLVVQQKGVEAPEESLYDDLAVEEAPEPPEPPAPLPAPPAPPPELDEPEEVPIPSPPGG